MKAVIFSLLVLIAVDVIGFQSMHLRRTGALIGAAGDEIGSWVFQR